MGQILGGCEFDLCDANKTSGTYKDNNAKRGEVILNKIEAHKDEVLFKELEGSLGFHHFNFSDIEENLKSLSKFGAITKSHAIEGFRRAGVIRNRESHDIISKFLITFEKSQGNTRIIILSKLLSSVLLLTKDSPIDKICLLFGIYAIGGQQSGVIKRVNVRQILDHLCFAVIYAIPNLAYHSIVPGFGQSSSKCNRVMEIKLEMQKKVYNDKQNLFKVIMGQQQMLSAEEFKQVLTRPHLKDILSATELRKRLTPIISHVQSKIVIKPDHVFRKCLTQTQQSFKFEEEQQSMSFRQSEMMDSVPDSGIFDSKIVSPQLGSNNVSYQTQQNAHLPMLIEKTQKRRVKFADQMAQQFSQADEQSEEPANHQSNLSTPDLFINNSYPQSILQANDLKNLIALSKKRMYNQSKAKHPLALRKGPLNNSIGGGNESLDMSTQIFIGVLKNKLSQNDNENSMYSNYNNESTVI
eukprot:403336378